MAQHRDNRDVLEDLVRFFGTGRVRDKGRNSAVLVYTVHGAENTARFIVPFFARHRLLVKQADFERFAAIVQALRRKEHLESDGFERLVRLAFGMNRDGKQRARTMEEVLRGSSETVREAPAMYVTAGDDPVRAAWRHAESGRNDLAALRELRRVVTRLPKVAKFLVG